ncbi:hypothetical protein N752_28035 [Desulforamulus aquiferis]|nr:hypothetical protein N752_28035 [Desulforamulus aquiferis]
MNLLSIENLTKSYGIKKIFEDVSLGIAEGEKIGLVGVNGTGKSSLLKVLAGLDSADRGNILMAKNLQVDYLPQNPYFEEKATVLEQVFKGTSPVMELLREYERPWAF